MVAPPHVCARSARYVALPSRASIGTRCGTSPLCVAAAALPANLSVHARSRSRHSVVVRASWGAPVEFTPAKVVSNDVVATNLHRIVVDVGDLGSGYTKPGQYIQAKVGDIKPGFFAIASPPDSNNLGLLELLIKASGEAAAAICGLAAGNDLAVSPVQGKGFAMERVPPDQCSRLLLFATGSGISPIKALIESGQLDAPARSDGVRLYYGTRDPGSTAYADRVDEWKAAGVDVVLVHSGDESADKRYVQDAFEADGAAAVDNGVGVVLCGHKGMVERVKELLPGLSAERFVLNF